MVLPNLMIKYQKRMQHQKRSVIMFVRRNWILLYYCLFIFILMKVSDGAYNHSLEEDLRTLLFTTNSYNRFSPPDSSIQVSVALSLYTLNKLEIEEEVMETSLFFSLTWNDTRLDWSGNSLYSSIPSIRTNNKNIWVPKVSVANSVSDLSAIGNEDVLAIVYGTGLVVWPYGKIERTHCDCDVTYYPFDSQICEIRLMGVGYTTDEVELIFETNAVDTTFFSHNGEWEYKRSETIYDDRTFETVKVRQLKFDLIFQRRPLFQFINSLLPVTLLSGLICLIFKLPADSGEKIGFCLTVLLAFAVYLTMISDHIPTTSTTTSYLSIYLIIILAIGVVSVGITIFVLQCHTTDANKPIPICLRFITKRFLIPLASKGGRTCFRGCCCHRQPKKLVTTVQEINENKKELNDNVEEKELSWKEIGIIVDSTCFHISLFCNIAIAIVMYSILLYGYKNT